MGARARPLRQSVTRCLPRRSRRRAPPRPPARTRAASLAGCTVAGQSGVDLEVHARASLGGRGGSDQRDSCSADWAETSTSAATSGARSSSAPYSQASTRPTSPASRSASASAGVATPSQGTRNPCLPSTCEHAVAVAVGLHHNHQGVGVPPDRGHVGSEGGQVDLSGRGGRGDAASAAGSRTCWSRLTRCCSRPTSADDAASSCGDSAPGWWRGHRLHRGPELAGAGRPRRPRVPLRRHRRGRRPTPPGPSSRGPGTATRTGVIGAATSCVAPFSSTVAPVCWAPAGRPDGVLLDPAALRVEQRGQLTRVGGQQPVGRPGWGR